MAQTDLVDGGPAQTSKEPEIVSHSNNPTDTNMSSITVLPNELLMQVAGNLAYENVEPHLDNASFNAYVQAQTDLRNFCLVSKRMDEVARPYLYGAAIVRNADVLAYLARTLDEQPSLGKHVKQLVFEVPLKLEDELYRKPDVTVLRSRQNFSRLCRMADHGGNVAKFEEAKAHLRDVHRREHPSLTFKSWTWFLECKILCGLQSDIIFRSSNLQFLGFGMVSSHTLSFLKDSSHRSLVLGSKVQHLQLLAENRDRGRPLSGIGLAFFLKASSLKTLKCVRDDGMVYRLDNSQKITMRWQPASSWQCKNIIRLDFQRSRCTPAAIFQLCATFPSLEYMSISVERGTHAKSWSDNYVADFGTTNFLSTGLSTLEHLRELKLDLHYSQNIKTLLGEHGVLNLSSLIKLTAVRIPLHCLIETQAGRKPYVTDLAAVIPPCVKHLTVWADLSSVASWGKLPKMTSYEVPHPSTSGTVYHPRVYALDFMEDVCCLLAHQFKYLKEATYCYGDQVLDTPCQCNAGTLCSHCEASRLLDIQATDDSATRMQILASISEAHGVCLRTEQEQVEG